MAIISAGHCDLWNDGTYTGCQFGPTGKGNDLAVYDESLALWKMVEHPSIQSINTTSCLLDTGSGVQAGQSLTVGTIYYVSTRLNPSTGNIDVIFTPASLGYVRADSSSGVMCAPGTRKWRITGQCYVHATYGIQGQANSEYLIGRHDLWTVGLVSHPAAPAGASPTYSVPGDSDWHELSGPLEWVTWADRLPTSPAVVAATVFGSYVGQSLQIAVGPDVTGASANPASTTCTNTSGPNNLTAIYPVSGGQPDGYTSLKVYARCNGGSGQSMRVGYAFNSTASIGIWF